MLPLARRHHETYKIFPNSSDIFLIGQVSVANEAALDAKTGSKDTLVEMFIGTTGLGADDSEAEKGHSALLS